MRLTRRVDNLASNQICNQQALAANSPQPSSLINECTRVQFRVNVRCAILQRHNPLRNSVMRSLFAVIACVFAGCSSSSAPVAEPEASNNEPKPSRAAVENVSNSVSPLIQLDDGVYWIRLGESDDRLEYDKATGTASVTRFVTREQFGEAWPYRVEQAALTMRPVGDVMVYIPEADEMFAVNGLAANAGLPSGDDWRIKDGRQSRKPVGALIEYAQQDLGLLSAFRDYMFESTGGTEIGSTKHAHVFRKSLTKLESQQGEQSP